MVERGIMEPLEGIKGLNISLLFLRGDQIQCEIRDVNQYNQPYAGGRFRNIFIILRNDYGRCALRDFQDRIQWSDAAKERWAQGDFNVHFRLIKTESLLERISAFFL